MPNVTTFDNSEIETWLACPRRWRYAYRDLLRPRVKGLALSAGSIFHEAVQMIYQRRDWRPRLAGWEAEKLAEAALVVEPPAGLADTVKDKAAKLGAALTEYAKFVEEREFALESGEIAFQWRVPGTFSVVVGRVDGLLRGADGNLWLLEMKTTSSRYDLQLLQMNRQLLTYTLALRSAGMDVVGVQAHVLYLGLPSCRVNKDRRPSTSASMMTDRQSLEEALAACEAEGVEVNRDLYSDLLRTLPTRREYLLQEFAHSWGREAVDGFLREDIVPLCRAIKRAVPDDLTYRNVSQLNCKLCAYAPLCVSELRGDDTTDLRAQSYYVCTGKHDYLNPPQNGGDAE